MFDIMFFSLAPCFVFSYFLFFFFFNATPPSELYTLSLHDALPISVQVEEVAEPVLDVGGVARARGARLGRLALEPSHLPGELVAVLAAEGRQVRVPRGRQNQDRTSFLDRDRRGEPARGGERRGRGQRG